MLDGISLDQLRTFVAAADEGSFSAAARKLGRVQSAVSGWIADLESRTGVVLFDRAGRFPRLTAEGILLLADAREIVTGVDAFKARAKLMTSGLEAELSIVVDVFVPTAAIVAMAKAFKGRFPTTPLRVFMEGLGAGYQPVLDGRCSVGILATLPVEFAAIASERLGEIPLVVVAAKDHPLAALRGRIPKRSLARHVQLVLTDRSELLSGRDFGVLSPSTWRLADLSTKLAFLRDGIGWGSMPLHMVERDLAAKRLVVLDVDGIPPTGFPLTISACHPRAVPPGPAGRWVIDHLKQLMSGRSGAESDHDVSGCIERQHV